MNWSRISVVSKTELRIAVRDGEQLLLTLGLPLVFLVLFSTVDLLPVTSSDPVNFIAPGIIVLALLSVAFVRPAISLGFDRSFGAIKRFATTPLTVGEFLAAKLLATSALFAVQLVLIVGLSAALGWRPTLTIKALAALGLGLIIFSSMAMVVSSVIDGLTSLAVANALYVVLLLLSGLIFDLDELPAGVAPVARFLPTTALVDLVRPLLSPESFDDPGSGPWVVLLVWLVASSVAAWRLFRWH